MTWLLPSIAIIPTGGKVRSVGRFNRTAYDRAYYHAKRKGKRKQRYTPEQQARRKATTAARYYANLERERAKARARYWKHRDRYAAAARERARQKRERPTIDDRSKQT